MERSHARYLEMENARLEKRLQGSRYRERIWMILFSVCFCVLMCVCIAEGLS